MRMLQPWVVRTTHVLQRRQDEWGPGLVLTFDCHSTTSNCDRLGAIVASLTWVRDVPDDMQEP